jgi:hypothetical protein
MKKIGIGVIAIVMGLFVFKGLDALLPREVLGFSSFVIKNPLAWFAMWLCARQILMPDKPFRRYLVAGALGATICLVVSIVMDRLV